MNLQKPTTISREPWLSAMGVNGEADTLLTEQMDRCEKQLIEVAWPKGVYRIMPVDGLDLKGSAIKKHLAGCHQMAIMGTTLGAQIDMLIRRSQVRDMADAVILDCGASVLIEQACDLFQGDIAANIEGYLTGRYSPGYGDLPIETQDRLIQVIDSPRKIGLTVNQSHIMIPRKSVTAILGIADRPVTGYLATCGECRLKDKCQLRKEGKNCAD